MNVRRIYNDAVEDFSSRSWAVWSVKGSDARVAQVTSGWLMMINSIEYPVQVLIRQHSPDFGEYRAEMLESRPDYVRNDERINNVANSMLEYLEGLEQGKSRVVTRRFYGAGFVELVGGGRFRGGPKPLH